METTTGQNSIELLHKVLVNSEEQYSIWPANRENPKGWYDVGIGGTRSSCLDWISKNWEDIRPRSLREKIEPER